MVAYVDVSTYMISLLMCHLIWTLGLLSCASWPLPSDTGPLICSLSALIETSYRSVDLCQPTCTAQQAQRLACQDCI